MQLNRKRIEEKEWDARIQSAVRRAFWHAGHAPTTSDVDVASQELRIRLLKPKTHEDGTAIPVDGYLASTARFSVLTYLAERFEKVPEHVCVSSLSELTGELLDAVGDPLYGGSLLRLAGEPEEPLETAPYEVQFTHDSVEIEKYRKSSLAIPSFRIVSRKAEAINPTWRTGQRRHLSSRHLTYHAQKAVNQQKNLYAECLRRALPGYMSWLGLECLKPLDRRVIKLINQEHLGDADVKRRLNIPHSTYNGLMQRLARSGFDDYFTVKDERVIKYNPILDSTQRFTSTAARQRIFSLTAAEVIEDHEQLYRYVAETPELTPDDVAHLVRAQRVTLLMAKMSIDVIERHDARLRSFIKLAVEKPVIGKGVTLADVETILNGMTPSEARDLVFRSLRYQKPVTEMLGLGYFMAA